MDFDKKCKFIAINSIFDEKYCTKFPKSAMLVPKSDTNLENSVENKRYFFRRRYDPRRRRKKFIAFSSLKNNGRIAQINLNEKVVKINFSN